MVPADTIYRVPTTHIRVEPIRFKTGVDRMTKTISLIIPCYNEEESFAPLYEKLCSVSQDMSQKYGVAFEFLMINDGSRDKTLALIKAAAEQDDCIKYIFFSRNFGKEAAVYAGLQNCTGDYAVVDTVQKCRARLRHYYMVIHGPVPLFAGRDFVVFYCAACCGIAYGNILVLCVAGACYVCSCAHYCLWRPGCGFSDFD